MPSTLALLSFAPRAARMHSRSVHEGLVAISRTLRVPITRGQFATPVEPKGRRRTRLVCSLFGVAAIHASIRTHSSLIRSSFGASRIPAGISPRGLARISRYGLIDTGNSARRWPMRVLRLHSI
jgi:hypothetical protein